jgi:hypothetical protein
MNRQHKYTRAELRQIDAVLWALDKIVEHELGDSWTLEAHMARKGELLEVIYPETVLQ